MLAEESTSGRAVYNDLKKQFQAVVWNRRPKQSASNYFMFSVTFLASQYHSRDTDLKVNELEIDEPLVE